MSTIATIWVKLGLNSADYNTGLDSAVSKAEKSSKSISTTMKDVGTNMMKTGGVMTAGLTVPIVAMGMKTVDAASNLEQSIGGVNSVFDNAANTIFDFGKTSAESVGLSERSFNQLSTVSGALLQNLGFDSAGAADEMLKLADRGADVAATFGGPVEDVLLAVNSALKGEFNPLEKFGVKMNMAAINAEALRLGLADVNGVVDDSAKAQAALSLFYEQTASTQGQFARESETLAGQQERLKANFENISASLGKELLPIGIKIVKWVRDLIDKYNELSPAMKKGIIIFAGIVAAIGPLVTIIGGVITAFGAIAGVVGGLSAGVLLPFIAIIAAIGAAVALLALAWKNNWGGIQEKTQAVIDWIKNKIKIFIDSVTDWWDTYGEDVIAVASAMWESVKTTYTNAFNFVKTKVTDFIAAVKKWWGEHGDGIIAKAVATWNTIKAVINVALTFIRLIQQAFHLAVIGDWEGFGAKLREIWNLAWSLIRAAMVAASTALVRTVTNLSAKIVRGMIDLSARIVRAFININWYNVGVQIIQGIGNGMIAASQGLTNTAAGIVNGVLGTMKGFLGIKSPSKVMEDEVGKNIALGVMVGIDKNMTMPNMDQMIPAGGGITSSDLMGLKPEPFDYRKKARANRDLMLKEVQ